MKLKYLTALFSPLDQEYNQAMSGPYEDLSFHDDDCKVIAGLKDNHITGFWRPVVACGGDKALKLQIERLYDICPNICYMDFLIDGRLSVISQFLLRHGHKARPYFTQVIDLTKSEEDLHAGLRKSYKSLVNKTNGMSVNNMGEFRNLSELEKGKKRSDKTWELQIRMPHMVCVQFSKETSGSLFYHNEDCAYYASAAGSDNHACLWYLIKWARSYGLSFVELGEQVFDVGAPMMERGKLATKKNVDISLFKRGFGGTCITRLILEK